MKETIGVAIATYNGEKYIEEQLRSIYFQTRQPDLLILSDGDSHDGTVKKSKALLEKIGIKCIVYESNKRLSVPFVLIKLYCIVIEITSFLAIKMIIGCRRRLRGYKNGFSSVMHL